MLRKLWQLDWVLIVATFLLIGVGLLSLYGISSTGWQGGGFFIRQAGFALIGCFGLFLFFFADYRHIARLSTPLYFVTLGVLLAVLLFGVTVRGTLGWINFGMFKIQPVEGVKVILVIFLARFIAKKQTELGALVRMIASMILAGAFVLLVLLQPDLGSALVLIGIWIGMILVAGLRFTHILLLVALGVAVATTSWLFLQPYQKDRIVNVFTPKADSRGSGYNVLQATVSIGSGGLTGKGIGHGSQAQLNFLPEKHTDFIFSTISEELGLLGAGFVILVYGVLLFRIWHIGMGARDNFGYLACAGVMIFLLIQITVNIGMNAGVLPVTGIPLPLISYGGSSLVATMCALGLILNIGQKSREASISGL
ncbi:MAG: rod shape-determining protein RodA [Candidatus Moraniibacteriota bacterium]